jgi:thiazole synthase ThiGH ThiG subunit
VIAGLPGCAIAPRDPDRLAQAVEIAIGAGRHAQLRESMHAYGRAPIAGSVLGVYRRMLARQAG